MVFNLFKKNKNKRAKELETYEQARDALETKQSGDKMILAEQETTPPEVLYYLAEDPSTDIRVKVAGNANTPIQADKILAKDENEDVKHELTRKIARLFPDISDDGKSEITEKALEMIEILANDQLPSVRRILSEELRSSNSIPKHIALKLAKDEVPEVCSPILEYSPLLNDADLKEIIAATTLSGALEAIAKRNVLSGDVCDAIAQTLEIPAVTSMLANQNAQVREDTLDNIIAEAQSQNITQWHEPLAKRPNLSMRAMKRIAGFVASSLVDMMITDNHLDDSQGKELLTRVRERISDEKPESDDQRSLAEQAADLYDRGVIDDEFIQNAIKNKQRELVIQALILMSGLPEPSVRQILNKKKGNLVVALAWKSELSMRTALQMQSDLAHVPPAEFVNAKNGVDFPFSDQQLEYDIALYE
ncbi:DUF2336 domain-containing protein [Pseudemcibacter aquimaris]|uniref:DUF2336 domain-containing protein n=1 Tax=Pseudemcibacter aquimaris TaxID=2857064 RepID=UPI002012435C|nr:DUF2336 domain-containing protein [Pseudemcibacter aquimaris]MCC3861400.1 DUF2336 domain-containing protein [Pseudemcibacter aquimaris]WDU58170.1 DUF2336 domain-containing protein [Pseudemcibacter aquimaris]